MNGEALAPLCLFCVVATVTPGPNNIMLLVSGVNFGFYRTLPHMMGIAAGFLVLLLAAGLGLGGLLAAAPMMYAALKGLSAIYLIHLAFRIATSYSIPIGNDDSKSRPLTFLEAAGFQWINPKAWIMALSSMALYVDKDHPFLSIAVISIVFSTINWPSLSLWVLFGTALSEILVHKFYIKLFNVVMGLLLVISIIPIIL